MNDNSIITFIPVSTEKMGISKNTKFNFKSKSNYYLMALNVTYKYFE